MSQPFDLSKKIYVAGHRGLVGSALMRALREQGAENLLFRKSSDLDLRKQKETNDFFRKERPDYVFLAAAKVGGIIANSTMPADFLYDNLLIQTNVMAAAHQYGTAKLLFLGSSCIYPKFADQPITESSLLTGPLEPTNDAYAIAKIAGIRLCDAYRQQYGRDFISAMPTNLYGPADHYDLRNSHVMPALMRRFIEAKAQNAPSVAIWGTGTPLREFLHVNDLADACLLLMDRYNEPGPINIGSGSEISIFDLAQLIAKTVGYKGKILTDPTKPDGTPRKLLDCQKIQALSWQPKISLEIGISHLFNELKGKVWS
jgi:GDP-L-fucose synthase